MNDNHRRGERPASPWAIGTQSDDLIRGARENAHAGLVLSGDFGSPEQLLAADHLSDAEKLAVLDQWLDDVEAATASDEMHASDAVRELIASIEDARGRLQ